MKFYHGSKFIIEKPLYKGSHINNDYGPAFYVTTEIESAKSWACKNDLIGVVNEYIVDDKEFKGLKVLDLRDKNKYSVLNWIAILMHFRKLNSSFIKRNQILLDFLEKKYYIDIEDYDVIIGYRADDNYFRFPIRFIENDLSFEDLENIYLLGDLGIQYAFISKTSINLIKYNNVIECDESFLGHYYKKIKEASLIFDEILSLPRDPHKTYILDLIRNFNDEH